MAIDKVMGIQGASITWTNKQIAKMIEKQTISFDNVVQRGEVWEVWRMSELIWSIIMNYPVPPIYCERSTDDKNEKIKHFDCLDGKQRCTTIYKFLNDKFALTKLKPIPYLDEDGNEQIIDISGRKFSELDEELQDVIRDSTIAVRYYDNLDQPKKAEMFRRLNQGRALSTKARTLASARDVEELLNIGNHQLFNEMLTEKSRQSKNQVTLVMKAWAMLNLDIKEVSFASKDFNPMIEETEISDTEKLELNNVFDFVVMTHEELKARAEKKIAKKLFTETHLISLIPYFKQAMKKDISDGMMAEWLIDFFMVSNDSKVYEEYEAACSNGVARNTNIVTRHEALGKSFEEFFKVENAEEVLTTALN